MKFKIGDPIKYESNLDFLVIGADLSREIYFLLSQSTNFSNGSYLLGRNFVEATCILRRGKLKRLRYFRREDGTYSTKGISTHRDIVTVYIKKLTWKVIASTGEILNEGTEKSDQLVRKEAKQALIDLGASFDDDWRNS